MNFVLYIFGVIFMKFCLFSFSGHAHARPFNRAFDTSYIVFTCFPSKTDAWLSPCFLSQPMKSNSPVKMASYDM